MGKWAVTGFYGQGNFGDDLFCYVMASLMERHRLDYEIQNGLLLTRKKINSNSLVFAKHLLRRKDLLGKMFRVISAVNVAFRGRNIVFGGGSLFGMHASYPQRRVVTLLSRFSRKKLFAFCVSLGPFRDAGERKKYRRLLASYCLLVTRDHASASFAKESSLRHAESCDMVFAIPDFHPKKMTEEKKLVLALHKMDDVDSLFAREAWIKSFDCVSVLALDKESMELSQEVTSTLAANGVQRIANFNTQEWCVEDLLDELSSASFVVTSKLHGAITAAAYGVPFALLEYQEKCTEFLRTLTGFEDELNFGDQRKFAEQVPKLYASLRPEHWKLDEKRQKVSETFEAMLSAAR